MNPLDAFGGAQPAAAFACQPHRSAHLFGGRYPSSSRQHSGRSSEGMPLQLSSRRASRSTTCSDRILWNFFTRIADDARLWDTPPPAPPAPPPPPLVLAAVGASAPPPPPLAAAAACPAAPGVLLLLPLRLRAPLPSPVDVDGSPLPCSRRPANCRSVCSVTLLPGAAALLPGSEPLAAPKAAVLPPCVCEPAGGQPLNSQLPKSLMHFLKQAFSKNPISNRIDVSCQHQPCVVEASHAATPAREGLLSMPNQTPVKRRPLCPGWVPAHLSRLGFFIADNCGLYAAAWPRGGLSPRRGTAARRGPSCCAGVAPGRGLAQVEAGFSRKPWRPQEAARHGNGTANLGAGTGWVGCSTQRVHATRSSAPRQLLQPVLQGVPGSAAALIAVHPSSPGLLVAHASTVVPDWLNPKHVQALYLLLSHQNGFYTSLSTGEGCKVWRLH